MRSSLLELQHAVRRSLLDEADDAALGYIVASGLAPGHRLSVYRNTMRGTLGNALRLSYPAVQRLVGEAFFDGAAQIFAAAHPPRCADLYAYGEEFANFLQHFAPAASLAYLPDVARLEWAVNRALHAPDAPALDLSQLGGLAPDDHGRVRFTPHPSMTLLRCAHPADAIWRAVLQGDDAAMAAIDLTSGSVHLLVQRLADEVEVLRLDESEWRFAEALFGGKTLGEALAALPDAPAAEWLAQHLAADRCVAFRVDTEDHA
jgi:hypothetical protein